MKQFTITFLAAFCMWFVLPNMGQAQEFEKGTSLIKVGIGVGDGYVANLGSISFQAGYELGIVEFDGIGNIGVGARLGYRSESEGIVDVSVFAVGPQATFHVTAIDVENLDLYGGIGIDIASVRAKTDFLGSTATATNTEAEFGLMAGANYYFSDNIAVFGELGINRISLFTAGAAFRF